MKITKLECTSCGHPLEFTPGDELVTCRFCGSVYAIEYDRDHQPKNETDSAPADSYVLKQVKHREPKQIDQTGNPGPVSPFSKHTLLIIAAAVAVAVVLFLLFGIRKQSSTQPAAEPPVPVTATPTPAPAVTPDATLTPAPTPAPTPTPEPTPSPTPEPTPEVTYLTDLTSIEDSPRTTDRLMDNYGNPYTYAIINNHGFSGSAGPITYEYLVDGTYNVIRGILYIPEGETSSGTSTLVIRGDGHTIYTSPSLDKRSRPEPFEVNITGFNDIQIQWSNNSGYSNISDLNCCLGEACFVKDETMQDEAATGSLPYSILDLSSSYSSVRKTTRLTDNHGNHYSNAIYNRVDSYHFNHEPIYEYLLDSGFTRFTGTLYVPEGVSYSSPVNMLVYADDQLIYTSPPFTGDSEPVDFEIDITDCNNLKITFSASSWYDSSSDQTLCLANGFLIP